AVPQSGLVLPLPVPGRVVARLRLHLLCARAQRSRIVGPSFHGARRRRVCTLVPARTRDLPRRTGGGGLSWRGGPADCPAPRQEIAVCLVGDTSSLELRLCLGTVLRFLAT